MCIIAIKDRNNKKMFSDDIIKTMFSNNPDGAGFMYNKNGIITIKKGYFNVNKLLKDLHRIDFNDCDLVLHFRIRSSGAIDESHCHPFIINNEYAFAHNGILYEYEPEKKDNRSDTMIFNDKVLKNIDIQKLKNDNDIKLLFNELIGTNKMAFMDNNSIFTFGNFINEDGLLFSNSSYKKQSFNFNNIKKYNHYDNYIYDDYDDCGYYEKIIDFDSKQQRDQFLDDCIYECGCFTDGYYYYDILNDFQLVRM